MLEFLLKFEEEFKKFVGKALRLIDLNNKPIQVRLRVDLVVNGKYRGVYYVCAKRGLRDKLKLITKLRKTSLNKALDFMDYPNGLIIFKGELKYWHLFFKSTKYTGTVIKPIITLDPKVVQWTFDD